MLHFVLLGLSLVIRYAAFCAGCFLVISHMLHFGLFGLQIEDIRFLGGHLDGDAFLNRDAVAGEAGDLFGVVGQQEKLFCAQVMKDLGADAIIAQVWRKAQLYVGFYGIQSLFL